jgi:hypothetical protein
MAQPVNGFLILPACIIEASARNDLRMRVSPFFALIEYVLRPAVSVQKWAA